MESGPIANWASQSLATATSRFDALARNAGCPPSSRVAGDANDANAADAAHADATHADAANADAVNAAPAEAELGASVVACLRAKNTSEIVAAAHNLPTGMHSFVDWAPVIDSVELLDDPQRLAARGQSARQRTRCAETVEPVDETAVEAADVTADDERCANPPLSTKGNRRCNRYSLEEPHTPEAW